MSRAKQKFSIISRRAERPTDGATDDRQRTTNASDPKGRLRENPSGLTAPRALPEGWKWERLGDSCLKTPLVNPEKQPDKLFRYVDVSSVSNESYRIIDAKELLGKDAPSRARKSIQAGDVIFATVRPTLKRVAVVPQELEGQVCSTGFCVLRADESNLESSFLYFHLLTEPVTAKVEFLQKGATYPAINDSDLLDLEIPLPPLPVQRAIARALHTIQQARAARQRELTLERERKAALMEHLFTHGTRTEPRKQTEIGEMPQSWRVVKLGEISTAKNGINFSAQQKGKGILTVDVLNMYSDSIYVRSDKLYRVDTTPREDLLLQPNDILFVRSSLKQEGVGWAALFGGNSEPMTFCGFLIRTRLTTSEVNSEFLINYLRLPKVRSLLVSKSGKVAITNINQANIGALPIPVPSLDEQRAIAATLRACDVKIAALEREAQVLDELFRATLDELMAGKLSACDLIETNE